MLYYEKRKKESEQQWNDNQQTTGKLPKVKRETQKTLDELNH